jgi:hypothetical protein
MAVLCVAVGQVQKQMSVVARTERDYDTRAHPSDDGAHRNSAAKESRRMWYRPRIVLNALALAGVLSLSACDSEPTWNADPPATTGRHELARDTLPVVGSTSSDAAGAESAPAPDTTGRGGVFVGSGH